MDSETVDLIATDPPFKRGRDFHATPDSLAAGARFQDRWSWERDVHQDWIDELTDDYPRLIEAIESARYAHSDAMGAYMCFMAVRLLAMHRVLKETGSIYLHCDPTASHYLKAVMDAVFLHRSFINEIIWCYSHGGKSKRYFGRKNDRILVYGKGREYTFNSDAVRIPMKSGKESFGGRLLTDDDGRSYRLVYGTKNAKGETRYYKYYLDQGKLPEDYWTDINSLQASSAERIGYPTQKPLALYKRIIEASSNKNDIVLDPFAGGCTTCSAAEHLGRQWAGIDIWEDTPKIGIERMEREVGLFGNVTLTNQPPERTDDGLVAAPFLRVKERIKEPNGQRWTRAEMYDFLLKQQGSRCQGCDRAFDDPRYLELDHNTPRSDGGLNHITNRILLCGPCNKLKSNQYTLSGLRRQNKKLGYLVS